MRCMHLLVGLLVFPIVAIGASAQSSVSRDMIEAAEFMTRKEADAVAGASKLAPIQSLSDLDFYLRSHKQSPFNTLSNRSRELFLDELVFTEKGLASYRYREIELELTPRQAYELLSLFGVESTIGYLDFKNASEEERIAAAKLAPILLDDHKGYRCVPPATCDEARSSICIGVNCGMYTP